MRRTSLAVVVAIATIMVFSVLLVPLVGATSGAAPLLQTTATAVGTEAATTTAATCRLIAPPAIHLRPVHSMMGALFGPK